MKRLIIIGPPGAGKGTQGKRIAAALSIPTISTGEIFRYNVQAGTRLGQQVSAILATGAFVSDDLTNELVADRLRQPDAVGGFLLDGYPRTENQVAALDEFLAYEGHALDAAIELTVDEDVVVKRLLDRAAIEGRADDTEDVIRTRMAVYAEQTAPLIAVYQKRNLVLQVDGMGSVDEVTDRVMSALRARG